VTFPAGGRQRQASWQFDLADRTVVAVDDEARWLSEDEQPAPGPIPAPHLASVPVRATTVYDVEAEGGVRATHRPQPAAEPVDLMTAMRERSTARGRRRPGGSRRATGQGPADLPVPGDGVPEEALPLDHIAYDPETMPPPPSAHGYPGEGTAHETATGRDETAFGPSGTASPGAVELDAPVDAEAADTERGDVADTAPAQPGRTRGAPEAAPEAASAAASAAADEPAGDHPDASDDEAGATPPAQQSARRNGRPSVPSWDDIMFGARPGSTRR